MAVQDKYEPKGDFGAYNEPSWVPDGFCKCCATVRVGTVDERKPEEELTSLTQRGTTANKDLPVRQCPVCDNPS